MSVRKRTWTTPNGEAKTAWVVDYTDTTGKRRKKSFKTKQQADAFANEVDSKLRLTSTVLSSQQTDHHQRRDVARSALQLSAALGRMMARLDHEKEG